MFTIDSKGTILLLNDSAVKLFGYDYSELLGEPISKICGGNHAAKHQQYMENYVSSRSNSLLCRLTLHAMQPPSDFIPFS
jgi:two-component system sensor kinase FixL